MTALPTPPLAWWINVPPEEGLIFLLIAMLIVVVIGPWMVARAKGKPSAMQSREQALVQGEAVLTQQRNAHIADLIGERERIIGRLRLTEQDRDEGWDLARGAELLMHQERHERVNLIQMCNGAYALLQRVATGDLRSEVAAELAREHPSIPLPDPLPSLRSMERKKPGETPYAT